MLISRQRRAARKAVWSGRVVYLLLLWAQSLVAGEVTYAGHSQPKIRFLQPNAASRDNVEADIGSIVNAFVHGNDETSRTYDVTHPRRVDSLGRFISHNVKFLSGAKSHHRHRRDLSGEPEEFIYFNVDIDGRELTLNVSENRKLLHSNFVVERLRNGVSESANAAHVGADRASLPPHRSSLRSGTSWPCHFRGKILGHADSAVALSTCNGLTGLIRVQGGDYFIEPMIKAPSRNEEMHPHKIYKRQAMQPPVAVSPPSPMSNRNGETSRKTKLPKNTNSGPGIDSLRSDNDTQSSETGTEFCGVSDTRKEYRKSLRARARWEAKRRRKIHVVRSERRRRRSLSLEQWIEMMVVVDRKMVEYYEAFHEGEIEKYVLTIVNMVSELFHDESIGNSLHVTLMRLILLEGDEKALKVSQHAERTLDSFCRWAKRMNPRSDYHANHHDVAILLTRRNICSKSNKSCETLGLAHVAGMCQSHRSCSVNQDTGLALAFTVAHELGHNFAMHHDGQLNTCEPDEKLPRIMAPHLTSNNQPMLWSQCSRRYVTRFLDRNWGFCLMDVPSDDRDRFDLPTDLPGILYDADHQCQLMFGPRSRHCRGVDDMCNRLWCLYRGSCRSRLHAAVDGTKCGKGRWCLRGACVLVGERPSAIDGSWSAWSPWSRCSRTCGVGVTFSARYCDKPAPQHGGRYCLGERRRQRTCNVWSCPKRNTTTTFREEQCSHFNNIPYRNKTYIWHPVASTVYPCELHCYTRSGKVPFADRLRDKVVDGTPCFERGNSICVGGLCKRLGCDLKIDSLAREDKCGICRGDGTTCSDVTKTFNLTRGEEYVSVGVLPMGARNIYVREAKSSGNILALKHPSENGSYYLNGGYMIQWDLKFALGGTTFSYQRVNSSLDNITAPGPLAFDVEVMVLFIDDNPGIEISYLMPHNVSSVFAPEEKPSFQWMMREWSSCSRTCGKGVKISKAVCIEKKAGMVDEDFCDVETRPDDRRRVCTLEACPPEWLIGPWQPCSVSCGNKIGRQRRLVICIRSVQDDEQVVLNRERCSSMERPERVRRCSSPSLLPCPEWRATEWSICSVQCGGGFRNRTVTCDTKILRDIRLVEDVDVGSMDDEYIDDDHSDSDNGSDDETVDDAVVLPGQTEHLTINKITIIERRKKRKNYVHTIVYDTHDDDKCDAQSRLPDEEACGTQPCTTPRPEEDLVNVVANVTSVPTIDSVFHVRSNVVPEIDRGNDFIPTSQRKSLPGNTNPFESDETVASDNSELDIDFKLGSFPQNEAELSPNVGNSSSPLDLKSQERNINAPETSTTATRTYAILTEETSALPNAQNGKWLTGLWGQCSTTCGMGARIRNVICSTGPANCNNLTKPAPAQRCTLRPCAKWLYGGWTKCSRLCGKGLKYRKVHCRNVRNNQILRPYHCKAEPRLRSINTTCSSKKCYPWKTSQWSQCNVTCGHGYQRRRTACSKEGMCKGRRPIAIKPCMLRLCVEWTTSSWNRCSVNCGNGLQHRVVQCVERDSGNSSNECKEALKPGQVRKCNNGKCHVTDFDFSACVGDRLKTSFCRVLKKWGKCVQPSLAIQCCSTCRTFTSVRRKDTIS